MFIRSIRAMGGPKDEKEIRWTPMLVLSGLLHLGVFLLIMFIPESMPSSRGIKGIVYEVDLVEMPSAGSQSSPREQAEAADDDRGKAVETIPREQTKAKRIQAPEEKKKPLVVAKRTVIRKSEKITKPKVPPAQLIEKAISRIEKKVEEKKSDPVKSAIAKLKEKVGTGSGTTSPGGVGGALNGLPIRIYQMEVENWIKGNWSYPVATREQRKLEAIVLLKVKEDGTILESTFQKRSADIIFDQSVEKAIEKSDPLPPFPEGYRKSYEEFEINFNLRDLEDN